MRRSRWKGGVRWWNGLLKMLDMGYCLRDKLLITQGILLLQETSLSLRLSLLLGLLSLMLPVRITSTEKTSHARNWKT